MHAAEIAWKVDLCRSSAGYQRGVNTPPRLCDDPDASSEREFLVERRAEDFGNLFELDRGLHHVVGPWESTANVKELEVKPHALQKRRPRCTEFGVGGLVDTV